MGIKDNAAKKRKRARLYKEQDGKCFYCGRQMLLITTDGGNLPNTLATIEHLDDRLSNERGKHPGEVRTVLACKQCNQKRGQESVEAQNKRIREARKRWRSRLN